MVSSDRADIDPALLPPSPREAYYHGLRAYHQMNAWRKISDNNIDPLSCGWKISNGKFSPIMTDIKAGLADVLKINRCGWKGSCSSRYTCRNSGLKCAFSCKKCHGVTCGNVTEDRDITHEEDEDLDENVFNKFD